MTKPQATSVAVLSGGLDSTVALALALEKTPASVVLALTFDYGQRAREREIAAAQAVAEHFRVPHQVVALPWLEDALPQGVSAKFTVRAAEKTGVERVWVPNRNGVLLNIAASFAEARGAKSILFGSNREEAEAGFPDNTEDFRERINESLEFSTKNHVKVVAPVGKLYKRAIVAEGLRLGVPFDRIWSCYGPHEKHCGTCDSCKLLKKAIAEASAPSDLISFLQ